MKMLEIHEKDIEQSMISILPEWSPPSPDFHDFWDLGKCHRPLFLPSAPLFSAELLKKTIQENPKSFSEHIMLGNLETSTVEHVGNDVFHVLGKLFIRKLGL